MSRPSGKPWESHKPAETIAEHRAEAFRRGQQVALARAIERCKRSRGALRAIDVVWDEEQWEKHPDAGADPPTKGAPKP